MLPAVRPLSRAAALALAMALLALAGCSDPESARAIVAPTVGTVAPIAALAQDDPDASILSLPPGFVPADNRTRLLPVLPKFNTDLPVIPVFGGKASITGSVVGPEGKGIPGATVRIERFVDGAGGFAEVTTNDDGQFFAYGVFGGHYRLRSWLAKEDLTTLEPQTAFIESEENREMFLAVQKRDENHLIAALEVGDPHVGQPVVLRTQVFNEDIDEEEGIVTGKGIEDVEVTIAGKDNDSWDVAEEKVKTDVDGFADFVVTCTATGVWPMLASTPDLLIDVIMPECLPLDPEGTTPPPTDPEAESTTTTTKPFPMGNRFTVPYLDVVPPGSYRSTQSGCNTAFEALISGRWVERTGQGQILISPYQMRNFRVFEGGTACTFTRTI